MKITECKITKTTENNYIIDVLFDNKYPLKIDTSTDEAIFDNEINFNFECPEIEESEISFIEANPNEFFLNNKYLQDSDVGGSGINIYLGNNKKLANQLALTYDCYLSQLWDGNGYDYTLWLQMEYRQ